MAHLYSPRCATLTALLLAVAPAGSVNAAGRHTAKMPNLSGIWAMEGTGPAGFVAAGGRVATLVIRQRGHTLSGTIRSGGHAYTASGNLTWPSGRVSLAWTMSAAGTVRFVGTLQSGTARALGAWADGHGDDGGALLVRVPH